MKIESTQILILLFTINNLTIISAANESICNTQKRYKKMDVEGNYNMTTIKDKNAFILMQYYYANPREHYEKPFSLTENKLPNLDFSDELVPLESSPTGAVYFQDPNKVETVRFVYSKIFAEIPCDIIFSTISHSKYKIWLNGLYVGACTGFDLFSFFLTLKKGVNEFIFEIDLANANYFDFNNRIALQSEEENNPQSLFYKSCLEYHKWIQFFQTPDCRESDCSCIFIPRCYRIISSATIKIYDDFGNLLEETPALPGIQMIFSTDLLRKRSPKTIRLHLLLEVVFTDDTTTTRNQIVLLRNYADEKASIILRYQNTLKEIAEPYTKNFLINEFGQILRKGSAPSHSETVAIFKLKNFLYRIEKNETPYYMGEKNSLIYYKSPLDSQYRKIRLCTPPKLTTDHPGLIIFVNVVGNSDGMKIAHILEEHSDLIIVDLNIAGFSTGSPISEALITEALDEVRKLYVFDERRLYWYGFCNNGSAVWSFCQNHPHLATKIVTIEALPDSNRICNLKHTDKLIYLGSVKNSTSIERLTRQSNSNKIVIRNSTHNYMRFYQYRSENFSKLDTILPKYPSNINFSTERLRFNKSFWITLNSIRRDKKQARVSATIESTHVIKIKITNCDDFSIEVPPQMSQSFNVNINGVSILCKKQPTIRFVRQKKRFCISLDSLNVNSKKGTGLIDVYYGPLRIIHDGSNLSLGIAQKFSEPEAASFSPKLNVKFPIYSILDCPRIELNQNLVLVNINAINGKTLDLPIKVTHYGYTLPNQSEHKTDCCVLQRIPNPNAPSCSILHISSNNFKKFKNHLLLRKVILPSMLTGISPLWNNEALIITQEETIPIYEW